MNTLTYIHDFIYPAAFAFLPEKMNTARARAMLTAIGLQESRFNNRVQLDSYGRGVGPAHGFWQFEPIAVTDVLSRATSRMDIGYTLGILRENPSSVYAAITHHDVLACVMARLKLWNDPRPLPAAGAGPEEAWKYYVECWVPGKPIRETWDAFFSEAWSLE